MKKTIVLLIFVSAGLSILFLPAVENDALPLDLVYPQKGLASWYVDTITATGEAYDENDNTCAMRHRDFNKYYKICNMNNGKCVIVRHNNWGPAGYLFQQGRVVDLSKAAFASIAELNDGLTRVSVKEEINTVFE